MNEKSIYNEIDKISSYLKGIGFFNNVVALISKKDDDFIVYYNLGIKIKNAIITIPTNIDFNISQLKIKNNSIDIKINQIESTLNIISKSLDNQGKSFSEVSLKNIKIKETTLFAELNINPSEERKIDKVIIKDYVDFPKSYIKHFYTIDKKTIFNQQKLAEISSSTKALKFASEIKPPEVLFAKDSTLLYIYLKKRKNNSFDGLINFASKENGGILFNGHVDLKLNNILDTGENFELFWNSVSEQVQDFRVSTKIPYVFRSAFTPELSFSIYKQDSTFLNTKFHSLISYPISTKTKIAFTYDSESSENLLQNSINTIQPFDNSFLGIGLSYIIPNEDNLFEDLFNISVNTSFGNRKSDTKKTNQFKINFISSFLWNLNYRNSFFIRNETGYLNSNDFLDNELFRIGGANSLRGFNEQSIFTSKYSYFNTEYRYLTLQNSYLFSITDFGFLRKNLIRENDFLLGIGIGYSFQKKDNNFKISYVISKSDNTALDFESSKIIVNWTTFF